MEILINRNQRPKLSRVKATCPLALRGPTGLLGELAASLAVQDKRPGNDLAQAAQVVWAADRKIKHAIKGPATLGQAGPNGPSVLFFAEVDREIAADSVHKKADVRA